MALPGINPFFYRRKEFVSKVNFCSELLPGFGDEDFSPTTADAWNPKKDKQFNARKEKGVRMSANDKAKK